MQRREVHFPAKCCYSLIDWSKNFCATMSHWKRTLSYFSFFSGSCKFKPSFKLITCFYNFHIDCWTWFKLLTVHFVHLVTLHTECKLTTMNFLFRHWWTLFTRIQSCFKSFGIVIINLLFFLLKNSIEKIFSLLSVRQRLIFDFSMFHIHVTSHVSAENVWYQF